MSTPAVVLGPDAQVFVGVAGTNANFGEWAVIEGSYRDTGDDADTTDSFNIGTKHSKTGLTEFSCDITMQHQSDVNEFAGPTTAGGNATSLGMTVGSFIYLTLYPLGPILANGAATGASPYLVPFFRIRSWEGSFRVKGSEPETVRFSGVSSGGYTLYDGTTGGALLGVMPPTIAGVGP
jgi:hypothetical protein